MLPNLRAVFAATLVALALLMAAFGAVAMFRVAQDNHGVLQADLAQRARALPPLKSEARTVMVIDTPGPHLAPPPALPIINVRAAPVGAEVPDTPIAFAAPAPPPPAPAPSPAPVVAAATPAPVIDETPPAPAVTNLPPAPVVAEVPTPPKSDEPAVTVAAPREAAVVTTREDALPSAITSEPAIGGPFVLPRPAPTQEERAAERAERAKKLATVRKARAEKLARQRKAAAAAAAGRAAQARAKQQRALQQQAQPATSFNNGFGNSGFGGNATNTFNRN